MNEAFSQALHLIQKGLRVFPVHGIKDAKCTCGRVACSSAGKHPVAAGWQSEATLNADVVAKWAERYPDGNVGIATGAQSGVFALDLDLKPSKGVDGRATLTNLETSEGALPPTLTLRTGSGGRHLLYRHPGTDVPNTVNRLGPGIDTRGDGGFIVGPGSAHHSGGVYYVERDLPIADSASWLVSRLPVREVVVSENPEDFEPASLELLAHVRSLLATIPPAIEGEGGDAATYAVAARLRHGFGLSNEESLALLTEWNERCVPPWSEDDLVTKLERAASYGKGVYGEERNEWLTLQAFDSAITRAAPTPTAEPESPYELTYRKMLTALGEHGLTKKPSTPKHDPPISAADLFEAELGPTAWQVTGLFTTQSVGVIAALPKSSKTWLVLEVAVAIASGAKVCGEFEVKKEGPVLVFCPEDSLRSIRNRLRALMANLTVEQRAKASKRLFVKARKNVNITSDAEHAWLLTEASLVAEQCGEPLALLTLDPLRDIHSQDENSSTEMALVTQRLRATRDILGCTVLFAHHAKKPQSGDSGGTHAASQMRGSSAVWGAMDFGLYFGKAESDDSSWWNSSLVVQVKAAKGVGRFDLRFEVEDDLDGEAIRTKWQVLKDSPDMAEANAARVEELVLTRLRSRHTQNPSSPKPFTANELAKEVGGRKDTALNAIKQLADRGLIEKTTKGYVYVSQVQTATRAPATGGTSTTRPTFKAPTRRDDDSNPWEEYAGASS